MKLRIFLLLTTGLLASASAHAQTINRFTSSLGAVWNNPQNWQLGVVPSAGQHVEIAGVVPIFATPFVSVISNHSASATSFQLGNVSGGRGILYIQDQGSLALNHISYVGAFNRGELYISTGGDLVGQISMAIGYQGGDGSTVVVDGVGSTLTAMVISMGDGASSSLVVSNAARVETIGINTGDSGSPTKSSTVTINGAGTNRGVIACQFFRDVSSGSSPNFVTFDGGEWEAKTPTTSITDIFTDMQPGKVVIAAGGAFFNTAGNNRQTVQGLVGAGRLTKLGTGTLTLTGASTHSGGTASTEGTLQVTGQITHTAQDVETSTSGKVLIASGGKVHARAAISNTMPGIEVTGSGSELNLVSPLSVGASAPFAEAFVANAGRITTPAARLGGGNTSYGGLWLNGGTSGPGVLATHKVQLMADGIAYLYFNGGTLRLLSNQAEIIEDLGAAEASITVLGGGATIDTAGFDATTAIPFHGAGNFTKTGTGTLILTGDNTNLTGGTLVNDGFLIMNRSSGRPAGSGPLTVAAAGGVGGIGSVNGTAQIAGRLHPGYFGVGQLNFSSSLALQNGSTTRMEFTSASQHDRVQVSGALSYGGTLELSFGSGYVPAVGQQFQLFTAGSYAGGTFQAITLSTAARAASMNYTTGVLTITAVVLPDLSITASSSQIVLTWPLNATGWSLMQSTTLAPNSWTPVTQTPIANGSQQQVTVSIIGQTRRFFRLQTP
jgi:autotransporter-associated beta strand protein